MISTIIIIGKISPNSLTQFSAALAAKSGSSWTSRSTSGLFNHSQWRATIIAEFTLPGRFAASGAEDLFTFNIAGKHFGISSLFFDIRHHFFGFGRGNLHIDPGGAFGAKTFLFVPVTLTNPFSTFRATVKMIFGFILGQLKSFSCSLRHSGDIP